MAQDAIDLTRRIERLGQSATPGSSAIGARPC